MTQTARHEEVHYCARCRETIAEEAKKDRDSGIVPAASANEIEPEPQTKAEAAPAPVPEQELRSAPRKQLEVDVGIHSDSHFFAGITGDVSRGGLFVATYAEIPVGAKITLDFELPNGRIVAEGTVRWLRSARDHHAPGFGVQFDHVDPAMMKLIIRFCQARPPLYYDQADDF
ncbi:MAG: PilZ domain-containing protein [Polyangiaceae bacterium]